MKKTAFLMLAILLVCLILTVLPLRGEERIYEDVIRLHVLAASNSERDQALKLSVRDAVLAEWSELLSSAESRAEAEAILDGACLSEIAKTAERALAAAGADVPVSVTLSVEEYPTRDYGSFALPRGSYLSLRIILGEGEGRNWWCVLFPPLCTAGALSEVPLGLSEAEMALISKKDKQVRFKTLEVLAALFDR